MRKSTCFADCLCCFVVALTACRRDMMAPTVTPTETAVTEPTEQPTEAPTEAPAESSTGGLTEAPTEPEWVPEYDGALSSAGEPARHDPAHLHLYE